MKSFAILAILWAVIFAGLMFLFHNIERLYLYDGYIGLPDSMIFSAVISTLLSVPIFLLWMVIRYLASKWSGS